MREIRRKEERVHQIEKERVNERGKVFFNKNHSFKRRLKNPLIFSLNNILFSFESFLSGVHLTEFFIENDLRKEFFGTNEKKKLFRGEQ